MEEATEYKKYLKALKEMTKKKNTSTADYINNKQKHQTLFQHIKANLLNTIQLTLNYQIKVQLIIMVIY